MKKDIKEVDEFNEYASEIFTSFLVGFSVENKLIVHVQTGDIEDDHWEFLYTKKGIRLAETMLRRLYKVGSKYFDPDNIEISSNLYQE